MAIKLLPEEFSADADRVARLEREAHLLAAINHPGIASIYDLERAEDSRFLVVELVEGESLERQFSRGPLPIERALRLCKQVAGALEAAHGAGVVHRDLKPGNIVVTADDVAKVLDFGLAKPVSAVRSRAEQTGSPTATVVGTQPGAILGTAPYMSPEQVRGKEFDDGVQKIFTMPVDGSSPAVETVGDIRAREWVTDISPYGETLVYSAGLQEYDLYAVGLPGGAEPEHLVEPGSAAAAAFSPTGDLLAFSTTASDRREVYVRRYPDDGSWGPVGRLVSLNGGSGSKWSPDGIELFFVEGTSSESQRLMVARVHTTPEFRSETPTVVFEFPPDRGGNSFRAFYNVMPDGEHFIFTRRFNRQPARLRLWVNWFAELKRLVPTGR